VTQAQYSYLIAAVVASAVVPTLIGNAFFLPRHHLAPAVGRADDALAAPAAAAAKGNLQ
jgi:hypothetical protein